MTAGFTMFEIVDLNNCFYLLLLSITCFSKRGTGRHYGGRQARILRYRRQTLGYCVRMHTTRPLKTFRPLLLPLLSACLAGCAENLHTLESTSDMSREELAALCADLEQRANQDCNWNVLQQQSTMQDRQTWEVNCQARRDSARRSYDNVCLDGRAEPPAHGEPPD